MKKNYKITFFVFLFLVVNFIFYSFFPVIFYDKNPKNLAWRIVLYDRFWEIITDKSKENWYFKSLEKVDLKNLQIIKDIVKIEDKNFYTNFWVDFLAKIRALKDNFFGKKVSWASTITEQYLKNKYFLNSKRTYLQKIREVFLAFCFSLYFDKNEILEDYLNSSYFWNNIYWISWAIEVFFNKKTLVELNNEEIVLLISLINNPWIKSIEETNFRKYFEKIKSRLNYNFDRKIFRLEKKENIDLFPFVTKRVLEENQENQREIILKTTIDKNFSTFSKTMLNKTLDSLKLKNVTNAAIVWFNPKTMEVLIYHWSRDFYDKKIDWQVDVIKSKRQLWSTLKPFLYLQSLQKQANIDDFLIDLENQYNSFKEGKVYISENYSLKEYGLVRFRKALWNSLNNASVRLAKEIWLEKVWQFFKDYWLELNFSPEYYWYSLVLWNPSLSLENLVLSYTNLLPEFEVKNDRKLNFIYDKNFKNEILLEIDKNKFLLYEILKNPDNRDISFWVNSILNTSIFQAVKTGTSSDFRDNVIVSYNKDFVLWIWVWNNDNSSMIWVSGITWAWYLWHQIIEEAISKNIILDVDYKIPETIKKQDYCLDEKCFRKEIIYIKNDKKYSSSIIDNKYYLKDIYGKPSILELEKLSDLWFFILK